MDMLLFKFFQKIKKSQKLSFYGQVEAYGAQRKTVILVCKFLFRIQFFLHPLHFYLSTEGKFLRFFY